MTPAQHEDLERVMGGPVELLPWRNTVRQAEELAPAIAGSDAVAAVLPPELLCKVLHLAGNRPVIQALSARRPTGRTVSAPDGRQEPEFAFVHTGWQQIVRMELETRML